MTPMTAPRTRVAVWQCEPGPPDVPGRHRVPGKHRVPGRHRVAGNLRRLDEACARAAARRAAVLVTPEMFTTGYALAPSVLRDLAEDAGGPVEAAVAEIARRHKIAIAYGHPERAPGGGVYNAATLIGPDGAVRGRHRKVHLFGDLDRDLFMPSPAPPSAFDFDGGGSVRVGLLICYDVEFPEAVRRLAVDGARVVLVPTANMTGYEQVQRFVVRTRAYENGCGVCYANYCGADDTFSYGGLSVICGPGGEVLAQAGPGNEELIVADIPGESSATYLADRRAILYE